jgi:hypothetical protein
MLPFQARILRQDVLLPAAQILLRPSSNPQWATPLHNNRGPRAREDGALGGGGFIPLPPQEPAVAAARL